MEGSQSVLSSCELPTGLKVGEEIFRNLSYRELSGAEEDILASKKIPVARRLTNIMSNCIKQFGDVEEKAKILKMVEDMTIADRIFFLIHLRMSSVGNMIKFESVCPSCEGKDKLVYDLNEIKILNPPMADALFTEIELPVSKKKIRLVVGNGKAEEKIEKLAHGDNEATIGILVRVDSIDDKPATFADVRDLPMSDRNFIRKAIDKLEGDVDDKCHIVCIHCGHEYDLSIPIAGADFFFP